MRTKIFTIILIAISLNLSAQDFAPVGAKWYYSQATINPNEHKYKTFESVADTVINSIQCRKIIESGGYTNPHSSKYHYMFSRNDSVFFYAGGTFNLLYDFGAQPGDTIVLPYFLTYDNSPLKMIIDSVRSININGHSRILQNISCGDGLSVGFGPKVIEGIGATYFMFPSYDMSYDGPLRCYEDAVVGQYKNPLWVGACDTVYFSGIEDYVNESLVSVYPNPFKLETTLNTNFSMKHSIFTVYNSLGQAVKQINNISGQSVVLSRDGLPAGMYFIRLTEDNRTLAVEKIVISD